MRKKKNGWIETRVELTTPPKQYHVMGPFGGGKGKVEDKPQTTKGTRTKVIQGRKRLAFQGRFVT